MGVEPGGGDVTKSITAVTVLGIMMLVLIVVVQSALTSCNSARHRKKAALPAIVEEF